MLCHITLLSKQLDPFLMIFLVVLQPAILSCNDELSGYAVLPAAQMRYPKPVKPDMRQVRTTVFSGFIPEFFYHI